MLLEQILLGPAIATSFLLSALLYKVTKDEVKDHIHIKIHEKYIQAFISLIGITAGASAFFESNELLLTTYALGILIPSLLSYRSNKILKKSFSYFIVFLITYEIIYIILSVF